MDPIGIIGIPSPLGMVQKIRLITRPLISATFGIKLYIKNILVSSSILDDPVLTRAHIWILLDSRIYWLDLVGQIQFLLPSFLSSLFRLHLPLFHGAQHSMLFAAASPKGGHKTQRRKAGDHLKKPMGNPPKKPIEVTRVSGG